MSVIPQLAPKSALNPVAIMPNSGMNTSLNPDEIDDAQASDLLNLWYHDRLLRERPGLVKSVEQTYGEIIDICPRNGKEVVLKRTVTTTTSDTSGSTTTVEEQDGIYILTKNHILTWDGSEFYDVPFFESGKVAEDSFAPDFSGCKTVLSDLMDEQTINSGTSGVATTVDISGTGIFISGNGYYARVGVMQQSVVGSTQKIVDVYANFYSHKRADVTLTSTLDNASLYIPTIYVNMKPSGLGTDSGDVNEPRNILTPFVKCSFSTEEAPLVYKLPDTSIDQDTVTATLRTHTNDTTTWTWAAGITTATGTINGATVTGTLDRSAGTMSFDKSLTDSASYEIDNNLVVQYAKTKFDISLITNCNILAWFGGSVQGQESGACLFLSGNKNHPNKIWRSKTQDPSYFPEDGVQSIGEPADPVVAFGKNFGIMLILKQHSTYQLTYSYDASNESSSLYQNSAASSVGIYSAREVNPRIGCDCPDSVQVINNRLCWLNSTGGIYTMVSTYIQDERAVQPISRNVNSLLLSESKDDLQSATSIDTGTYYIVFVGTHAYLWDYESTPYIGYNSYAQYSSVEKSAGRLAWYRWEIPRSLNCAFLYENKIYGVNGSDIYKFDDTSKTDDGDSFQAYFVTKYYDFNVPTILKIIRGVSIEFGNVEQAEIVVTFEDDSDDYETQILEFDPQNSETVQTEVLRPPTYPTQHFDVRIEKRGDEPVSIGKIIINAAQGRQLR